MDPMKFVPALYYIVTIIAVVGWVQLIFWPRRHWANFWFAGVVIPLVLSLFFCAFIIMYWLQPPQGSRDELKSLEGIYAMFGNHGLLLAAWTHLLAMDLVVGAWMARKAAQMHMPYVYLLPCLLLTFSFAGFGFVLFAVAMSFGERWFYIARVEQVRPIPRVSFAAVPADAGASQ